MEVLFGIGVIVVVILGFFVGLWLLGIAVVLCVGFGLYLYFATPTLDVEAQQNTQQDLESVQKDIQQGFKKYKEKEKANEPTI